MEKDPGVLYVVATPIGNLEDITLRALNVLSSVDLILCEDTRTTSTLLIKNNIKTKTSSYHSFTTKNKEDKILSLLESGSNIALVSDAGTPCISDPGVLLVKNVYAKFGINAKVIPIPGASALISALSASGVSSAQFVFLGFLPHKKGREKIFTEISSTDKTIVFYESTHRIMKTLESLHVHIKDRNLTVAREITKQFEQFIKGTPAEILDYFSKNKDKHRGEFVFIIEPK